LLRRRQARECARSGGRRRICAQRGSVQERRITQLDYMPPIIHYVEERDEGRPLVKILRERMMVSRSLLSKLKLTERGIEVNGRRVYTNAIVYANDEVALRMAVERSEDI